MNVEDIVIGILAEDHDIIPYRKSLRKIAGSVTATILLQQMIWRGKHHDWQPFYKFKSPCKHELYAPGDSWTEEVGLSEEEFDAAIKRIGTKITRGTSKGEALGGSEPTSLVIYWTDASRVTWYHVNKDLLGKLLLTVYLVEGETPVTLKTGNSGLPLPTKTPSKINDDDHASHSKPSPQPGNENRRRRPENATSQTATAKAEPQQPAPTPVKEKAVNFSGARGQREPADPEYTRVKTKLQENRFGHMAGDTERIFKELWEKYDHGWFDRAIESCLKNGKPTLSYLEGILKRWVVEGPGGYKANGGKPPPAPLQLLTLKRWCLDRYNTDNPKFVREIPEDMIREQYEQYRKQYYQQQQAH